MADTVPEAWYGLRQGMFLKPLSDLDPQQRACDVMRNDLTSPQPDLSSQPEAGTPSWVLALLPQGPGSRDSVSLVPLPMESHLSSLAPRDSF